MPVLRRVLPPQLPEALSDLRVPLDAFERSLKRWPECLILLKCAGGVGDCVGWDVQLGNFRHRVCRNPHARGVRDRLGIDGSLENLGRPLRRRESLSQPIGDLRSAGHAIDLRRAETFGFVPSRARARVLVLRLRRDYSLPQSPPRGSTRRGTPNRSPAAPHGGVYGDMGTHGDSAVPRAHARARVTPAMGTWGLMGTRPYPVHMRARGSRRHVPRPELQVGSQPSHCEPPLALLAWPGYVTV